MLHPDRKVKKLCVISNTYFIISAGEELRMNVKRIALLTLSLIMVFVLSSDVLGQGKGKGNGKGNGQSQGKSKHDDDGWNRDEKGKGKAKKNDSLTGSDNRFRGLSKKLGRSPESLRDWYNNERAVNPNLSYGQFVAANMVARNHNMSAETILRGLRRGRSIGQILKGSGWDDDRIKNERKRLKKMRDDDGIDGYMDSDIDWRF
jgi:hypothetical protein